MSRSTVTILLSFAAFAAFSAKVKVDVRRKEALQIFEEGLPPGTPAPHFSLMDVNGATVQLEEQVAGRRAVLVNFWATWCAPCRLELPQFERLYTEHRDEGLQILGVNVGEDEETVRAYLRAKPVSFPVLLDKDKLVSIRYRVGAFPTTIIVDKEGKVQRVVEGLDPYLQYRINSLLEQKEGQ
jgi:thiol-disulfide isomerase/thioredoxin